MSAARITRVGRVLLLGSSTALTAYGFVRVASLLAEPAPFRQPYWQATCAQNLRVASHLLWGMLGAPLGLFLAILAMPGGRLSSVAKMTAGGAVFLLFACLALAAELRLPYGFGSEYEHISKLQELHLHIVGKVFDGFLLSGAACIAVPRLARGVRRVKEEARAQEGEGRAPWGGGESP